MSDLATLYQNRNAGFEDMDEEAPKTPILCVSQALSTVVTDGLIPVGHFYDTNRKIDLGISLDVIPIAFAKMWFEWKPNQGGLVGRWKPNSIPVTGDPFNGGMFHGENKVVDTFVYALLLASSLDMGPIVYTSSPGNIKYLKQWNTALKNLKLPGTNTPAPIYSAIWNLKVCKTTASSGRAFYCFGDNGKTSISFVDWVKEETAKDVVFPLLEGDSILQTSDPNAVEVVSTDVEQGQKMLF